MSVRITKLRFTGNAKILIFVCGFLYAFAYDVSFIERIICNNGTVYEAVAINSCKIANRTKIN